MPGNIPDSELQPAITVTGVSKDFVLPHEKKNSVKHMLTGLFDGKIKTTQHALHDISFTVQPGEFFGIVGRNGSGKSTMLKILAGIYQPTKGSVAVNGKLVPFIELGVGFNPELTGKENVYLNGALLGFSEKHVATLYDDIVQFAELEQFMDQKLKNYSSGMQVRLAFSVAIMAEADILLIDEVLAVGDADFQRKCFEYFKSLKDSKKTVIFVSHDMGAVQQYCDRAALIDKSKLVDVGNPATIAMEYNRLFLEEQNQTKTKAVNGSGEERWGDKQITWKKVTAAVSSKENPATIAIRAEGIAKQDVAFPIFGFSVKDSSYHQITGMNTVRKQHTPAALKQGERFTVSWEMPNIFNNGTYFVDCTAAHDQAAMVSDRWPEAASFVVKRLDNNPYPLYTDATFLYTK
jgi:ABC-2 type transport system ATP-binding protein